jgi:hypothetical protein
VDRSAWTTATARRNRFPAWSHGDKLQLASIKAAAGCRCAAHCDGAGCTPRLTPAIFAPGTWVKRILRALELAVGARIRIVCRAALDPSRVLGAPLTTSPPPPWSAGHVLIAISLPARHRSGATGNGSIASGRITDCRCTRCGSSIGHASGAPSASRLALLAVLASSPWRATARVIRQRHAALFRRHPADIGAVRAAVRLIGRARRLRARLDAQEAIFYLLQVYPQALPAVWRRWYSDFYRPGASGFALPLLIKHVPRCAYLL